LEFYRVVSPSARWKKRLLAGSRPFWQWWSSVSLPVVAEEIRQLLAMEKVPDLTDHASALISPTRDKLIVHHHGRCYEKSALGKSLPGVRRELAVYQAIAEQKRKEFTISQISESESGPASIRLRMEYAEGWFDESVPGLDRIVPALAEFFQLTEPHSVFWGDVWAKLFRAAEGLPEIQSRIEPQNSANMTPVGLVHRDFKPWNVKNGGKLLFFDFESADFCGCPLEDLLNYVIDPKLNRFPPEKVFLCCRRGNLPDACRYYLRLLKIPENTYVQYLQWYLLERTVFWKLAGQENPSRKFLALYDLLAKK
jgi:hypothetical protein